MHVRLDRISNIHITGIKCRHFSAVSKYIEKFDSADYSNRLFNMFSGDTQRLEICCHNSIIEEILDRFGQTGEIKSSSEENRFRMVTKCIVSDGLAESALVFAGVFSVFVVAKVDFGFDAEILKHNLLAFLGDAHLVFVALAVVEGAATVDEALSDSAAEG